MDSNLGLRQGCPLSPILFNLYIDDISEIFDNSCDPVQVLDIEINHFLYADDLALVSGTQKGLQNCLNALHDFSVRKELEINISKSKTMIFNSAGRLLKNRFHVQGEELEPVHTFCYLGFDLAASGTVKYALNNLYDKAIKAMRPLLCTIAKFDIPIQTSQNLFQSYVAPIMLYNAENWAICTDKKLETFSTDTIFTDIANTKADILHRKFLKLILGVSKSCPNIAIYGETAGIPLSLKGYEILLKFWYRTTNLDNNTLAKKALLENINLRTNWVQTIENLMRHLNLCDKVDTPNKFKISTQNSIQAKFKAWWKRSLDSNNERLNFYRTVKNDFLMEKYLHLPTFGQRKQITKLRCSDHQLEIEKGRH